mgnify:CR=1 FL=1
MIIQGGSVGVAIYAIYALTKIISELKEVIGNHIDHSTEAQKELTVVIGELKEAIKNHFNK